MTKIITDIEKINTLKSTIIIFFPNGETIAIEKILDLEYHIKYLQILSQVHEGINNVLSNINMKYYLKHPEELSVGILPKFAESDCVVYMNSSPHIMSPTDMATIWLPPKIPQKTKETLNKMRKKFSSIIFLDIGEYDPNTKFFNSKLETFEDINKNSDILYKIVNEKKEGECESTNDVSNNKILKKFRTQKF